MHERFGGRDASTWRDDQAALHQIQKVGVVLSDEPFQRLLLLHVLSLRVVELLQQEMTVSVEVLPLSGRQRIQHLLRNLPHDLLDQREMQQVVVLRIIAHAHTHRLEQQVAGEQLHGDAPHTPNIRLLVPLHAQQHLGRAVLACVDGAFPTLVAVCRAAVVDHYT